MAAPFLLLLLLVASGVAVGGDNGAGLSHLELGGHASDAPPQALGLVDYLQSTHSCARFAALVAATTNASDVFSQHIFAGLTVFCPDDLAVAAFELKFNNLSAADQVAVLLLHGVAARYGREQLAAFDSVTVRTLAVDAATNKTDVLTVRDDGETMWLWPSRESCGAATARVTKDVSSGDSHLAVAVYVIDKILLPDHLRQPACTCTPRGGYLGWLHHTVPMWAALCIGAAALVGCVSGMFTGEYVASRRQDAAMN